jgi:hypothetical protein
MRRANAVPSILAATLCLTCGDTAFGPPIERDGEALQTDRLAYEARSFRGGSERAFALTVEFRNPTSYTLYVGRCKPDSPLPKYHLDRDSDAASEDPAYSPAWACVDHNDHFPVPAGASRTDTFLLIGPTSRDGQTGEAVGAFEGRFRLRYDVRPCPGDAACASIDSLSLSNAFDVRLK